MMLQTCFRYITLSELSLRLAFFQITQSIALAIEIQSIALCSKTARKWLLHSPIFALYTYVCLNIALSSLIAPGVLVRRYKNKQSTTCILQVNARSSFATLLSKAATLSSDSFLSWRDLLALRVESFWIEGCARCNSDHNQVHKRSINDSAYVDIR